MVAIISRFGSLRFRLIFTIAIVVFSLGFENSLLLDTENLQNEIKDSGTLYSEKDTILLNNLDRIGLLLDNMEREQISSFIVDIYFKASLNEITGDDTVRELNSLIGATGKGLGDREISGYLIETESSNQLFNLLPNFQSIKFGGYEEEAPIIDRTDDGANTLYTKYLNQSVFTNQTDDEIFSPNVLNEISNDIRASHNLFIKNIQLNNEPVEVNRGAFAKLEFLFDKAVNDLTEETNQTKSGELLLLFEELENQITEYVSNIVEFENVILGNRALIQANKIKRINEFSDNQVNRSSSIQNLHQKILESTSLLNFTRTTQLILLIFENTHNSELQILSNNAIQIGSFIAETKLINFQINAVLVKEVIVFEEEYEIFLEDIQNELQRQTQITFILIILITIIFLSSVSLTLVRYFSKYENNYKKIEEGNLQFNPRKGYGSNEMGRLEEGFDNMVGELKSILSALQRSSERMAGIAEELAAGAEEASASVQEVSNTVREFSSGAAEQNIMLSRIDEKLSEHLKTIEEATSQINETSYFVLKVAKRTNILGLNASIEAAKAGSFGKGFNVVAKEVRKLSDDTKTSAREIAELVDHIEIKIKTTVRDILHEVNITKEVAENTAAGSEEANAATSEQVVMLNEISQTSNELSLLANDLQEILTRFTI